MVATDARTKLGQDALLADIDDAIGGYGIRRACRDSGACHHPAVLRFLAGKSDMGVRRLDELLRATGHALAVIPIDQAKARQKPLGADRHTRKQEATT